MNRHFRWVQLWCLGLVCTVAANAASKSSSSHSDAAFSGWFEGGYTTSWLGGSTGGNQFIVDNLVMGKTFDVTDKTKVVLDNAFMATSAGSAAQAGGGFNALTYNTLRYSSPVILLGGGQFSMVNRALYLQHICSDHFSFSIGHQKTGYGMENLWERYDAHSYYYSYANGVAASAGMLYGLGAKFALNDVAGNWSFSLLDGRSATGPASQNSGAFPSLYVAWNLPIRSGDTTITPAITAVAGRFGKGVGDLGFTGGLTLKSGMFWIAAEMLYLNRNTVGGTGTFGTTDISIWAEPGLDFGVAKISAKVDWGHNTVGAATTTTNRAWQLGGAISHEWADKYRVRLTYNHGDLSGNVANLNGGHSNDVRLLFGTKW